MAYADVEFVPTEIITEAMLDQMQTNAQHLRDENIGRVLVSSPVQQSVSHGNGLLVRVQLEIGSLVWYSFGYLNTGIFAPISALGLDNLPTEGLSAGAYLVRVSLQVQASFSATHLMLALHYFHTIDTKFLTVYGDIRLTSYAAQLRRFTLVGSHAAVL